MALGPWVVFALNVLSAVVAFLTSYYAYRFGKLAESPLLNAIWFGFMLLGVGLLAEAGTSAALGLTLVDVLAVRALAVVESFTYLTVQMLAYLVFAAGYALIAFGRNGKAVAAAAALAATPRVVDVVGLYRYALLSYFVVLVLLGFIVFEGFLIHSRTKSRFSLLVLLAFSLILAAHAVLLFSVVDLSGTLFLAGTAVQFLGFVSLLVFLLRSGRVGAG
jgi:hypothetical protein